MKAVVTDYIEDDLDWEAEQLAEAGVEFEAYQLKFKSEAEILEKIGDAEVVVVNMVQMGESLLSRMENCRLLIRHGTGYDNVDVEACTRHGIQFAYQPDYCADEVAEHAIALLFACGRKIVWSRRNLDESSRRGSWDFSDLFPFHRMRGKKLGILGVGRVGGRVYSKLHSFGFHFLGNDPYLSRERREELEDIEWVDKKTLFSESDYVTLHTPLNDETRHLANAETIGRMKPTAFLINTSRGNMVDVEALAAALKEGSIGGAGIDVYDIEPPPPDYPLFGLDNVVLTPHTAWASEEASWDIRRNILDDILAFSRGKAARYVVNPEALEKE